LANECPLANVSFGGFEGSPEAVSRNVEKKRSTGSRSLLTRTSKQVARTLRRGAPRKDDLHASFADALCRYFRERGIGDELVEQVLVRVVAGVFVGGRA
jgi:hypothetical protein